MSENAAIVRGRGGVLCALAACLLAHPAFGDSTPPINFERTNINLGVISDFDRSTQTFGFVNASSKPVRLSIGGCHFCGVPTSDKDVYQPGERGIVFVEVNPAGRRGVMRAGGTVSVVGIEGFHVDVEVTADVRPRVWVEPDNVVATPSLRGEPAHAEFRICGRAPGFAVVSATCDDPNVRVIQEGQTLERESDDARTCVPVRVTLPASTSIGYHDRQVSVVTTDSLVPVRAVSCAFEVVGELAAEPEQANLGALQAGQPFVSSVLVSSRFGTPIRVLDLEIRERGLFEQLALDAVYVPGGVRVAMSGRAPARSIQWTQATVALRSRAADGAEETLLIPFGASVSSRAAQPIERGVR